VYGLRNKAWTLICKKNEASRKKEEKRDCFLKFCNFGRSNTASWNHSAIRRLLFSLANLIFSFRAWHTGTLGGLMATR
ncbi:hypothetical protein MTR67_026672, partial [Solanum verrucosum]